QMKANDDQVTLDFLSSYYHQDGDHGAVTGGVGTEKLTDVANVFVVNIPLDSVNAVNITGGADFYSSASTDRIDNNPSSASSSDLRTYGTVSYSRKNLHKGETYVAKIGASSEFDYTSFSGGLGWVKEFNEGNNEFHVKAQVYRDNWSLIVPIELRGSTSIPSSRRNSYNAQATFAQVINKRMQFLISGEAIYMDGLLSTPFHRVYFQGESLARIEHLPDSRLKIPIGFRFNYYPADILILRAYYRFYTDDWGITAHTFSLDTPVKLSTALTLTPFYRYHTQTAADYFAPFGTHTPDDTFYTSDYDLSALDSHKIGLGFRIAPLYGMGGLKIGNDKLLHLKSLDFRTAYYHRSTGLNAFVGSLHLSFVFKK
ncbi:MAG: DUF3570 domain-containing protein, partial [Bacteroidetes bacterium]